MNPILANAYDGVKKDLDQIWLLLVIYTVIGTIYHAGPFIKELFDYVSERRKRQKLKTTPTQHEPPIKTTP